MVRNRIREIVLFQYSKWEGPLVFYNTKTNGGKCRIIDLHQSYKWEVLALKISIQNFDFSYALNTEHFW